MAERRDPAQIPGDGLPEPGGLSIDITSEAGVPVVRLAGELDLSNAARARAAVAAALAGRDDRVVFELGELEFTDSSGIAMLLAVSHQVRDVEVRHAAGAVLRVLQVTGLDQALRLTG